MAISNATPDDVLRFWFAGPVDDARHIAKRIKLWFGVDEAFDAEIRERFAGVLDLAIAHRFDDWSATAHGALALIIVLDQFPRNIFRKTPRAFANDALALEWCRKGIVRGLDRELTLYERTFFYLPFEHAEDLADQDRCVRYYQDLLDTASPDFREIAAFNVKSGEEHRDVIRRFGRFPHRNAILGRQSTSEELEWLEQNASAWGQGPTGEPG